MALPLLMPDLDAPEQEWIKYIKKLNLDELVELIDIILIEIKEGVLICMYGKSIL
jgi:hypothetical protein